MRIYVHSNFLLFKGKTIRFYTWEAKNIFNESKEKSKLWFTAYENDVYEMKFSKCSMNTVSQTILH